MTRSRSAPLSYGQELFWLLDRSTPGLLAYNVPRAFRIRGALDRPALQRALDALVERHEVLRSVYALEGDHPVQRVLEQATVPLEFEDLSALAPDAREAALQRSLGERARHHFDLAQDVLLRAALVRLAADEHVFFLLTHHIVSDGWSKSVTFQELGALYAAFSAGHSPALVPLALQFADVARRERARVESGDLEDRLAYWRGKLGGTLPVLELPTDRSRPASQTFEGDIRELVLPAALVARMRALGQAHGATLYMVLLSAYQTLLHRYTGQDDIITGSPTAGRDDEETQGLIGYFAGALVLRNSFAGDPTFAEVLERVASCCLDAYEHQDVPFERLVMELRQGDAISHAPLFRCVLTMEDTIPAALALGSATVEPMNVEVAATKFDVVLLFSDHPGGLRLKLAFRTALFDGARMERMLQHLRRLLEAACEDPSQRVDAVALYTPDEHRLIAASQGLAVNEGPATTLVAAFEAQAARVPDRLAVVGPRPSASAAGSVAGTTPLTYAELNARGNQLAVHLRALGVRRGQPVGLMLDRSVDAFVGLIGILKAGGAYMPLPVEAPGPRIAQQVKESGATVVVTAMAHVAKLPSTVMAVALDREGDAATLGALSTSNVISDASPDDLAYVLYTSGSTGVPKGVAVTHANAVHYARAVSRVLADVPRDAEGDGFAALDGWRFGMVSTLAADLGNTSVLPALLSGGTLHVLARDVATEPVRFAEYVGVHQFDVLKITPNHLAALTAGRAGPDLADVLPRRWVVLGGEALRPAFARTLLAAGKCRVLNHYGPTETTVGVLTHEATADALDAADGLGALTVPLGRPLANTRAFVLDARGLEQPLGIPGELVIGGLGVARGYLGRDDLTVERFVTAHGERCYRTGDRVRRLEDGTIEFLGRADDQVKVRGYRVEVGEVEQVLRQQPGVQHAVVSLVALPDAEARLVAYVVPKQAGYAVSHNDRPSPEKLQAWVAAQLPEYMVPSAVVMLDALPLTPNGKVDRTKLPAPGADTIAGATARVAPRSPTETVMAKIWREVLKRDEVGITESFLDLGGHSLLAIRVLGRISKEWGVRLSLRALFESPTIEQVAALVDAERAARADAAALEAALADIEQLSDADVARELDGPSPPKGA